ncbi:hypothetical protein Tco_1215639 [Tanacetum coccineum]
MLLCQRLSSRVGQAALPHARDLKFESSHDGFLLVPEWFKSKQNSLMIPSYDLIVVCITASKKTLASVLISTVPKTRGGTNPILTAYVTHVDEIVADNVIDEILTEINIEDSTTLVFTAPSTEVPSVSDSKPTHVFPIKDIQALITRALWKKKNIPREKPANVQSLATMQRRMDFLVPHVHNLGKSFPDKFADKMDSVVPRMVADALEKRLPELLTDTLMRFLALG